MLNEKINKEQETNFTVLFEKYKKYTYIYISLRLRRGGGFHYLMALKPYHCTPITNANIHLGFGLDLFLYDIPTLSHGQLIAFEFVIINMGIE